MSEKRTARVALSLTLGMALVHAAWAEPETLMSVAQKAVLNNPEVLQKWHAYGAATNEKGVAAGGYLPRVDLTAGTGQERRNDPTMRKDFERSSATLSLTQMLYDGFATRNEVRRLDHARRVRYFELLEISENTALEAGRAYFDVLRYRQLVALAEENYARHKVLFAQVQEKANAGVARKVDLEQATGRLALASANLLTETSNLHDVSARFQRIIGEVPKELEAPKRTILKSDWFGKAQDLLAATKESNPTIQAAVENVRAARASSDVRKAAYQPRFDLRLRNDRGMDLNGYNGETNNRTAEVLMTWNLFNGTADLARSRQYVDQLYMARDIRDKTCRDIRQTAAIAFNDTQKLTDQLVYLEQHRDAIGKARDAYRRQFEIGQRTLLDLLDTENEYFQSRRAYVSAEHDLYIARLRTQASVGNLLKALELTRIAKDELPDIQGWQGGDDSADHCPAESPTIYAMNKEALDARADAVMREAAAQRLNEAAAAQAQAAPVAVEAPAAIDPQQQVLASFRAWVRAWVERDANTYIAAYAPSFIQERKPNWVEERKRILSEAKSIRLTLGEHKISMLTPQSASISFRQEYDSPTYHDVVNKTLELHLINGKWLIAKEVAVPVTALK